MLPIPPDTLLQQRYRILNVLGEGGFGRTYLATDRARTKGSERTDADEFCEIQEFIARTQVAGAVTKAKEFFKQQAILLYQLQHPQVPRFWATFEERDRLFLVLDYIEGKTYGQLLEERRDEGEVFSEAEVRDFLLQVVPALGYIHSKGVIHREISPDNIILRSSDRLPVLSDFGVVKEFADKLQSNVEQSTIHSGKPGYAPPEQFTSGQLYPSSDLYALAVTAIVLLTGKEASALFTADRMNWDWRKWTRITDGLADILQRMLNPEPNERYQAAIEVYRDLQLLTDLPNSQQPAVAAVPSPNVNRPSEMPTVAVGATPKPTAPSGQTAITQLNPKSVWEKPQVFIPLGILISLLAGLGSWFAVTHLLHNKSPEQASTPPKQIDFNNPTIPTGSSPSSSPTVTTDADTIQPVLNSAVVKEGTVDATTPTRYKIAATSGQVLDIQLVPISSSSSDPTKSPLPTTGTQSSPSPSTISPLPAIPGAIPTQSPKSTKISPAASIAPITPTQVLMSVLSPTGTPLDAQADRVVAWRGQIDTAGDYTIELRPIAGLSGKAYPYKLSVTQLVALPSPSPSPDSITPSTGATPPLGIPVPSGSNGITPSSSTPSPTSGDSSPSVAPTIVPIETPKVSPSSSSNTESERPVRRRKRVRRTEAEPSPQVRQRRQVDSNSEETPTPRRRRRVVDSTNEETPTPRRRRRNRVANTETPSTATPTTTPKSDSTESTSSPKPEPIEVPSPKPEPIAVPAPRNNSVPSTSPSSGNSDNNSN